MTKQEQLNEISRAFELLGNPLRFKIFLMILKEGCDCDIKTQTGYTGNCVSGIMKKLKLPQSTVSTYIKDLKSAQLIECEKRGKFFYCKPSRKGLLTLKTFLDSSVEMIKQ